MPGNAFLLVSGNVIVLHALQSAHLSANDPTVKLIVPLYHNPTAKLNVLGHSVRFVVLIQNVLMVDVPYVRMFAFNRNVKPNVQLKTRRAL